MVGFVLASSVDDARSKDQQHDGETEGQEKDWRSKEDFLESPRSEK